MVKRLFVIDAMALAYRSFFAFGRPLATSDGFPTSAIFGTAMFMNKLISEQEPDFLAVVTDTQEPTFRHEMYSDYKATREAMPDELVKQLPVIFELFEAYGCEVIKRPGFEADDVIGSLVRKFAAPKLHAFIVSGDKDFLQLVDKHTFVYQPKKNEEALVVDVKGVGEKFNCTPTQVVDALALLGDKVDNVPGVPGIGEKGAAKLIGQYGSLEGIYEHLDEITGKRQKEGLVAHREDAFLSRELVTIKTDIALDIELDELRCEPQQALGNEELLNLYRRLEFRQLIQKTELILGKRQAPKQSVQKISKRVKGERSYVELAKVGQDLIAAVKEAGEVAFAVLAENGDFVVGKAEAIGFYLPSHEAFYVPINPSSEPGVRELLSLKDVTFVSHGLKRSLQLLWNAGLPTPSGTLIDTKICDYLLDPNSNKHDLEFVAPRHAGIIRQAIEDEEFVLKDDLANQLLRDAEVIYEIYEVIVPKVAEQNMTSVLMDIDMPLVPILAAMELRGVYLDADFLIEYSSELDEKAKALQNEIFKEAGEEFNLNSPKQLQKILFEKLKVQDALGIRKLKRTKTGFSTDETVLSQLSAHPIPKLILEYRTISKLKNTYVDSLPQHIHPTTNRLHTTLHQTVAATGRLSSDRPNLQNIPMRTEMGRRIRKAFVPQSKGDLIVSADYSQVEIRLLAHLANAEEIIAAFKEGLDIHRVTAAKIFSVPEDQVNQQMRSQAKAVNFGIIYGMGPQRLAQETGVTMTEAKEFIERYFQVYPGIKALTQQLIRSARTLGYSQTMSGRRRPVAGITDSNRAVLARAENIAINAPIQGTAADLIKLAMIRIERVFEERKLRSKMLLQIHDELMFSVPEGELQEATRLIKAEMEGAMEVRVPLLVEINSGANWLEAH